MFYVIDRRSEEPASSSRAWYDAEFHAYSSPSRTKRSERSYYRKVIRVVEKLAQLPARPRILDVACGTGKFLEVAQSHGDCTGLDFSKVAMMQARKRLPGTSLLAASAEALPFRSSSFDLLACWGSLEHFPSMDTALQEFARVLTPKGLLYVEVPNLFFVGYYLRYCCLARSPGTGQLLERYAGVDGWRRLLRSNGFEPAWEHGRNYSRGLLSFRPQVLSPLIWVVWKLSAALAPLHLRENYCAWLKKTSPPQNPRSQWSTLQCLDYDA